MGWYDIAYQSIHVISFGLLYHVKHFSFSLTFWGTVILDLAGRQTLKQIYFIDWFGKVMQ